MQRHRGKKEFDLEQQESFEALTSSIDAANLLGKLEVLGSADDLLNVRELRNQIAHEYVSRYKLQKTFAKTQLPLIK